MKFLSVAAAALALLSSCASAKNGWDLTITDSHGKTAKMGGSEKGGTWKCLRVGSLKPDKLKFIQYSRVGGKGDHISSCFAYVHAKDGCAYDDDDPPGHSILMEVSSKEHNGHIDSIKIGQVKSVEVQCYDKDEDITGIEYRSKQSKKAGNKCYHGGKCAWFKAGGCENHCGNHGYSHVSGRVNCGFPKLFGQKCCCIT